MTGVETDLALSIENVSFQYESQQVLENVTLHVKKGSFLGLVGPNGSGKSTLIKCILGLLKPQKGNIRLFGEKVESFKQWERVGFVSQKANSFNSGFPATVYEVVSMGLYGKKGLFRFLTRKDKEKVKKVLADVGMSDYLYKNIGELSGGQQQRVFIARALVSDPELLILDEPTVGVDVSSVKSFYQLLARLNREQQLTLLLVTHDIGAMSEYVSDVACLNKTLHFHGDTVEFSENHQLASFYGHDVKLLTHQHADGSEEK